jgi:hypothetical protein
MKVAFMPRPFDMGARADVILSDEPSEESKDLWLLLWKFANRELLLGKFASQKCWVPPVWIFRPGKARTGNAKFCIRA